MTYPVALKLPAGPAGFAPKLALVYNTGFGNGPLGRGWRPIVPVIAASHAVEADRAVVAARAEVADRAAVVPGALPVGGISMF